MTIYPASPNIPRLTSGPVRSSPWDSLNSAEGSPLSTGLQNRACQFPSTRLLSDIALGMSTLFRGSVPMSLIMADEVEEFQVEVVASFWVSRRYVPRLWRTPRAADVRGAVRKMEGLLG